MKKGILPARRLAGLTLKLTKLKDEKNHDHYDLLGKHTGSLCTGYSVIQCIHRYKGDSYPIS
jgi:hypothetical protein